MPRILFVCSRNSARSQMAEGFVRARNLPGIEAASAGTAATSVHPVAMQVMKEAGIDISAQKSKTIASLGNVYFDVVITMCASAAESCPILPGNPERVDWNLPDPAAAQGSETEIVEAFRISRDRIKGLVDDLLDHGYLAALALGTRCANIILENISDGIIAHDLQRRVFYFNRAAEEITGYLRSEVINRDCHDVFPGNFCGGKCLFCEGVPADVDFKRQELDIVSKNGESKTVIMTIKAMTDASGRKTGFLVSFRDITRERTLARRIGEIQSFSGIIGRDRKMLAIYDLIRDLADSNVPVMIQGESGTGKELVAAAIHNEGLRSRNQFVPVNCGALPESLLESELFGHVKGAFTGALRDKKGRFELADGGTIFLDEIGDISQAMQVKLLRVLQEGNFERVGGEITMKVNVRIISATNRDITAEIEAGRFREDLFYRLNVVPLFLPPLRERRTDIPLLAGHILAWALKDSGKTDISLSAATMDVMMSYDWPGNVRELQNWIQFALVKCKGATILPEHLPPAAGIMHRTAHEPRGRRKLDAGTVNAALEKTGGNKVEAANLLGVSRATLYRFLEGIAD